MVFDGNGQPRNSPDIQTVPHSLRNNIHVPERVGSGGICAQRSAHPPHLTVVSQKGVVPTLYLLAKIAGGWEGLMFENISGMAVDMVLGKVTYHSLENRLEKINKG